MHDFDPKLDFIEIDRFETPIYFPCFAFPITMMEWQIMFEDFVQNRMKRGTYIKRNKNYVQDIYPNENLSI